MKCGLIIFLSFYISAHQSAILTYDERVRLQDKLETEIDTRLPTSFKSWETLSVRGPGFKYMYHYEGDRGPIQQDIGNWEIFAERSVISDQLCTQFCVL